MSIAAALHFSCFNFPPKRTKAMPIIMASAIAAGR